MKTISLIFALVLLSANVFAQFAPDDGGASSAPLRITPEEMRLIEDFRRNPEPYRQIMRDAQGGGRSVIVEPRDGPGSSVGSGAVLGSGDVIDVRIEGGRMQFYGKREAFNPVGFRISRGEEKLVTFERTGKEYQTTEVRVAYRADGLHFDVPPADWYVKSRAGLIVVPQGAEWDEGTPIQVQQTFGEKPGYVSEVSNPIFVIRYVKLESRRKR